MSREEGGGGSGRVRCRAWAVCTVVICGGARLVPQQHDGLELDKREQQLPTAQRTPRAQTPAPCSCAAGEEKVRLQDPRPDEVPEAAK